MDNIDIFASKKSVTLTDIIIEKILPIIWALLLVAWLWYLIYTNIWINLWDLIKIIIWFIFSIIIISSWLLFSSKLRYFSDVIISIWVLLLYGTLIYWSRSTATRDLLIPEVFSLVISFAFTFIISFFASVRKSNVILILSMLWAYLTPFVIWQNDSWVQSISFNSYLIYFAWVNIVAYQLWKDLSIKSIIPLNILWLFFWTSSLYALSYKWSVINNPSFYNWDNFSAVLFLLISIFIVWSVVITWKHHEEKQDDWIVTLWYFWTLIWFILNVSFLLNVSTFFTNVLCILLAMAYFSWWYYLENIWTKYQHSALYSSWLILIAYVLLSFISDVNILASMLVSYVGLFFWIIYYFYWRDERLITYILLSSIWAITSLFFIYIMKLVNHETIYTIIALIPSLFAILIVKKSEETMYLDIWKFKTFSSLIVIVLILISDLVDFINVNFVFFYFLPLIALLYLYYSNSDKYESKTIILRLIIWWVLIWFLSVFEVLYHRVYGTFKQLHLSNLFDDWIFINSIFAVLIFYVWLLLSRKLQKIDWNYHPSFVLVVFLNVTIFLVMNYFILWLLNDFTDNSAWLATIIITTCRIFFSSTLLYIWMSKWFIYNAEKKLWLIFVLLTVVKVLVYDMANVSMQNKIIVMIFVWSILMFLSYFFHKKKSVSDDNSTNTSINEEIQSIVLPWIVWFEISQSDWRKINWKMPNLIKVMYYVCTKYWKTEFWPWELNNAYDFVKKNYKTELNKEKLDNILVAMKDFAEKGWKVTFI